LYLISINFNLDYLKKIGDEWSLYVKQLEHEADLLLMLRFRMHGAMPPLPHISSCFGTTAGTS
jgi:hypothetical protein